MNPNTYLISNYGAGITVGITGPNAEQDAILAENIYGCNYTDELFDVIVHMPSVETFKKFLILKEYFKIWDEHFTRNKVAGSRKCGNVMQFTRRAIKRAKLVMDGQVKYENYMSRISSRNNEYGIGGHNEESEE